MVFYHAHIGFRSLSFNTQYFSRAFTRQLRYFSTLSKPAPENEKLLLSNLISKIKDSKHLIPDIEQFNEIVVSNLDTLSYNNAVELTFIMHKNYRSNENIIKPLLNNLEVILTRNLVSYPIDSVSAIIRNYYEAILKGYKLSNKYFAETMLKFVNMSHQDKRFPNIISSLSSMLDEFSRLDADYKTAFRQLEGAITPKLLEQKSLSEANYLLIAFKNYYTKHLKIGYKIKNNLPIFDNSEAVLKVLVNSAQSVDDVYWTLYNYISLNAGSEDFIRHLEGILVSRFNELSDENFIGFLFLYRGRFGFDQKYIVYFLLKAFYEEFLRRFKQMSINDISITVYRLWWSCNQYGIYCDSRLTGLLRDLINDNSLIESLDDELRFKLAINILEYFTRIALLDNEEILSRISSILLSHKNPPIDSLLTAATSMSKHYNVPNEFWQKFIPRIKEILQLKKQRYEYILYRIYVNVKLHNDPFLSQLENEIMPHLCKDSHRFAQERLPSSQYSHSYLHRIVENYLIKHKINYEREFYDDYYIDLAIPSMKLAIEIQGPTHFLFPSMTLNGTTLIKIRNLERKGWRVLNIPYYYNRPPTIEKILNDKIYEARPLKY